MKHKWMMAGFIVAGWGLTLVMGAAYFQSLELPFQANLDSELTLFELENQGAGSAIAGHNTQEEKHGLLGGAYGVEGMSDSTSAGDIGVYGHVGESSISGLSPGLNAGVWGESNRGFGVVGSSNNISVFGWSEGGIAIDGFSSGGTAIQAITRTGTLFVADSIDTNNRPTRRVTITGEGDMTISGQINSGGADLADLLPAVTGLSPGDVLIINENGLLAQSQKAYQTSVVGVYSTQPGFVGSQGDTHSNLVPLALAGIVPVNVTNENGNIQPGDLLVAASLSGHAMRAGEIMPSGSVIGKALQAFNGETGTIQMLVMLR